MNTQNSQASDSLNKVPFKDAGEVPEVCNLDSVLDFNSYGFKPGVATDTVTVASVGMEGTPIPYRLPADNVVSGCILLCFFMLAYVFGNGKQYLIHQVKELFAVRERGNLFAIETGSDMRYRLLMVGQTTLLLALFLLDYSRDVSLPLFRMYPSWLLLGCYVGIVLLAYVLRLLLYTCTNWIFFDIKKNETWLESYSLLYSFLGIGLFPLALFVIYFELSYLVTLIFFLLILILAQVVMFYKCFNIFFNKTYGFFYFIVYFCTLEMIPLLLLCRAFVSLNDVLLIKF